KHGQDKSVPQPALEAAAAANAAATAGVTKPKTIRPGVGLRSPTPFLSGCVSLDVRGIIAPQSAHVHYPRRRWAGIWAGGHGPIAPMDRRRQGQCADKDARGRCRGLEITRRIS